MSIFAAVPVCPQTYSDLVLKGVVAPYTAKSPLDTHLLTVADTAPTQRGQVQPKGAEMKHFHHDRQDNPLELQEWSWCVRSYRDVCQLGSQSRDQTTNALATWSFDGSMTKSLQSLVPRRTQRCGLSWQHSPSPETDGCAP